MFTPPLTDTHPLLPLSLSLFLLSVLFCWKEWIGVVKPQAVKTDENNLSLTFISHTLILLLSALFQHKGLLNACGLYPFNEQISISRDVKFNTFPYLSTTDDKVFYDSILLH